MYATYALFLCVEGMLGYIQPRFYVESSIFLLESYNIYQTNHNKLHSGQGLGKTLHDKKYTHHRRHLDHRAEEKE